MPQVMMWVLRKVAGVVIESIVVHMVASLVPGRAPTKDLDQPALPKAVPVAELGTREVDPKVLLLAEMISTALDESAGGVRAVVANGIEPSFAVIVVNAPADADAVPIADADVVAEGLLPEHVDDEREHGIAA